ncbi:MAG: response regulator transcription factor [Eubacterium sp.]|nr:response regulator transcription factor [Eubacterium sp.]
MKVFLVEDEFIVREGIKKNIHWEDHGFDFCGEASDGELAFPLIKEKQPDIVITDIRMPFMDGLELSRLIKKELPNTKIIILSGHEEFEYAKSAIQIGVEEYLLKPISGEALLEVVSRVGDKIREEQKKIPLSGEFQVELEDTMENGKRELFNAIANTQTSEEELLNLAGKLELDITSKYYNFVMLKVYKDNREWGFSHRVEELRAEVEDMISGGEYHCIQFDRAPEGKAFLFMSDDEQELNENVQKFITGFQTLYLGYQDVKYFGSVGQVVSSLKELSLSYETACHAFSYRFLVDPNQIVHSSQMTTKESESCIFASVRVENLDKDKVEGFLRGGEIEEIDFFVDEYMRNVGDAGQQSLMFRQYIIMDMYFVASQFFNKISKGDGESLGEPFSSIDELQETVKDVDTTLKYIKDLFTRVMKLRDEQTTEMNSDIIENAKEFIREHYMDETLTLNSVASEVNVSPNHLSAMFSQKTGQTFVKFLTDIRLGKAKELLKCTSKRSNEICEEIGYKDPHYFSHIFKKNVGCSPKQYREGGGKE